MQMRKLSTECCPQSYNDIVKQIALQNSVLIFLKDSVYITIEGVN